MVQVVQVFSNPRAGSHSAGRVRALVRAFEDLGATAIATECGAGVPTIDPRATHVCVAAGDGTVRHVAGATLREGRSVLLSIYPAGTVNLLAMEAGYPREPRRFARMVLQCPVERLHYPVALDDGYFFACASVGPDSLAVDGVSTVLKRWLGRFAYGMATAALLWRWPRHKIVLDHAGGRVECEAFCVAKGRYYAGRMSFAPSARVGEPMLHVVALTSVRRRDYAHFLWTIACRRDVSALPFVETFTCTTLRADCAEALPLQADGDTVGTLPAAMTLCERPLPFC